VLDLEFKHHVKHYSTVDPNRKKLR
jgi:hypothetical protein